MPDATRPPSSLLRRIVLGAVLGLLAGFFWAVLIALDFSSGSSRGRGSSLSLFAPGTRRGCLFYVLGLLLLVGVTVGGVYIGHTIRPNNLGSILGGLAAYAIAWMVAGAIWNTTTSDEGNRSRHDEYR